MRTLSLAVAALSLVLATGVAEAGPKGCPPGLAWQNSHCLPPGQLKKFYRDADRRDRDDRHYYRVGDRIDRDYSVFRDTRRYGLDPRRTYWRVDDNLFEVDRNSGEIRRILGAIDRLVN